MHGKLPCLDVWLDVRLSVWLSLAGLIDSSRRERPGQDKRIAVIGGLSLEATARLGFDNNPQLYESRYR